MPHSEELLKNRLDNALFGLWFYEKYSKKMPSDKLSLEMLEEYKKQCFELMREYAALHGEDYCDEYIWHRSYIMKNQNTEDY